MLSPPDKCPCGCEKNYADCCAPLHAGKVFAKTAEQLMRSRFSAYVLKKIDYLYETTHPNKRDSDFKTEMTAWANRAEFTKLEVLASRQGRSLDKVGKVEFIAHYRQFGEEKQMHELSRFRRFKGKWHYFDGVVE